MVTIVISPLIALMKDQIDHLSKKGIVAKSINHRIHMKQKEKIIADLQSETPETCLLYVTPEFCKTDAGQCLFKNLMSKNHLAHIVVDEAHCISMWGKDFRRAYLTLANLRLISNNVPWVALTATSDEYVKNDIITKLGFKEDYETFKIKSFRSNLLYDVKFKSEDDPLYVSYTFNKLDVTEIKFLRHKKI